MSSKNGILFITNIPAFYKIRLFNAISKREKVEVLWCRDEMQIRNPDFYDEPSAFLFHSWSRFSFLEKIIFVYNTIYKRKYKIIIGGWDDIVFWVYAFLSSKRDNGVICESSYHESQTSGLRSFVKKIFLNRISTAYVPGKSNAKLLEMLGFAGKIIITHGVGLYRRGAPPEYLKKDSIRKFLYVGRLSPEKNLVFLIQVFNKHPEWNFTIVGFGPQEKELKRISEKNISFIGAIDNRDLPKFYRSNDVFILYSTAEPWGLVVEEALNNGLPVVVSDKVGCAEEIVKHGENGFIVPVNNSEALTFSLNQMCNVSVYNKMRKNVCSIDYQQIEERQIDAFLL